MSGWGCVHEAEGACTRVAGRPCDPGMKGCILAGRFRFSNEAKNRLSNEAKNRLSNEAKNRLSNEAKNRPGKPAEPTEPPVSKSEG